MRGITVKDEHIETGQKRAAHKKLTAVVLLLCLSILIPVAIVVGSADLRVLEVCKILLKSLPLVGERFPFPVDPFAQTIILNLRLPRIILSILVGAALSVSGVIFQAFFGNPLAEPYVLGTSAGAALGVALAFFFKFSSAPLSAFFGALGATVLVYGFSRVGKKVPITVLLLSGIALGSLLSAVTSLLMLLHKEEHLKVLIFTMGGFPTGDWSKVTGILPYLCVGAIIVLLHLRDLDLLLLGEEKAHQLGVDLPQLQIILVFSASLLVAAAVSASGIIGFVGLMVPHLMRLIVGPEHKSLFPLSALAGGVFLLAADTVGRTVFSPLELPVGIITALTGAPFFLYLLRRKRGSGLF
ncbi:MAG TPA: iron ABC transporter permease [Bacillota bacterium]